MTEFETVLMRRDNITKSQAKKEYNEAKRSLYNILEEGGSYEEVEDMLLSDYGLEMDYIMDLL